MNKETASLQILLVEDNPMDVLMTTEAVTSWPIEKDLHVVGDGEEAMDFVLGRGSHAGSTTPDLIILDLNLPKKTGGEVLAEIRKNPNFSDIMIVVVTTTDSKDDMDSCQELGASLCITKPIDFDEYIEAINSIKNHWLSGKQKDLIGNA